MQKVKATFSASRKISDLLVNALQYIKGGNTNYSIVDYPSYNNIGDSAIWVGQKLALYKVFGKGPNYVTSQEDYRSDLPHFCKKGVIFIQGGGNFGNLWPHHQRFRLRVLREHQDRKIVQLPQSIYFCGNKGLEDTKFEIGRHKNFHLFVRDRASYEFAVKEFDCPVSLLPDAAHAIPYYSGCVAEHDVLSLIRSDKESAIPRLNEILSAYGPTTDWEKLDGFFYDNASKVDKFFRRRLQYKFASSKTMMLYRSRMYDRLAQKAVNKGTLLLSLGELVISDRLHAHILCVLMGKRHISVESHTGKIGAYIDEWGDFGLTELVRDEVSLLEKLSPSQVLKLPKIQ